MPAPTNSRFAVAVHVLTYLASQGGHTISSETLAVSTNVNAAHVRKVLGPLRAAGLVESRPGVGGGWQLGRPEQMITLADVWTTLHGEDRVLGQHTPSRRCVVGRDIEDELALIDRQVGDAIVTQLLTTTIADLVTLAMRTASLSA